jgi:diguanylate cyclase (GGDEF)-like protein
MPPKPSTMTMTFHGKSVLGFDSPITTSMKQAEEIKNLKAMLDIDPMTGLSNMRGFEKAVEYELHRIERNTSKGFVLVTIDLDGMKGINDTLGHEAGDVMIKTFASRVKTLIRQTDTFCHKSGDEFWILAKDANAEEMLSHCKNIMDYISKKPLRFPHKDGTAKVFIEATYGIAQYSEENNLTTMKDIMIAADMQLNEAKSAKGNKRGKFNMVITPLHPTTDDSMDLSP